MSEIKRIDRNLYLVSFYLFFIIAWFVYIQDSFIYNDTALSPFYRSISHNGPWHLFKNSMSLLLTSSVLIFFVTYRFIFLVSILTGVVSYWFYQSASQMIGFSIVTSGLMGAVFVVFLLNCYILAKSHRVKKHGRNQIRLNGETLYVKDRLSKGLFAYHFVIFLFMSSLRVTDTFMQSGIIGRDYSRLPSEFLHASEKLEYSIIIEAHVIGFITGVVVSSLILIWFMAIHKQEYNKRLAKFFRR